MIKSRIEEDKLKGIKDMRSQKGGIIREKRERKKGKMNGKEKTAILKRQLTGLGQGVLRIEGW